MKKKIVSLTLAVAMCFSLLTFTVPSAGAYEHTPTVSVFNGYCNALFDFVSATYQLATGKEVTSSDINAIASQLKFPRVGKVSYGALENCVEYYNASLYGHLNALIGNGKFQSRGAIRPDFENGIYRIYDHAAGHWVADSNGNFPYTLMDETAGDVPAGEGSESAGACRWLSASGTEITNNFRVYSKAVIDAKALELTNWGHPCQAERVKIGPKGKEVECWAIRDDYWYYYCDEDGNRLVALVEPSVTDDPRPSVDNDGNLIEGDNGFIMDNDNGIFAVIDQIGNRYELDFDGAVWDFSDNSYTLNAYTTVNEGDNYYLTYYTYNIQYNITNTYITYIGSNEAYEREEYELYYQLPDGRSSADLTAEEVAGMSFEFYDVVNYARSATDISVRALYHFDGNLEDSSYFSASDRFKWLDGASITYMESPSAFGGNLYLDNTAHSFEMVMPSNFATGDYTIQFRYYQASEPDTQSNIENSIFTDSGALLNDALIRWDEGTLYNKNGIALASLPVGTWNEIALVRHLGRLFYYLNGHCIGDVDDTIVRFNNLNFNLGETSRAYSMIDELRVLNFAIAEGAVDYQPTNVPHDSNLVLVLPDSDRPSADEYFDVESSYENLLGDAHNYLNGGYLDNLNAVPYNSDWPYGSSLTSWPKLNYRRAYSASVQPNSLVLSRTGNDPSYDTTQAKTHVYYYGFGINLNGSPLKENTNYTISIVHEDGTVDSWTFNSQTFYKGGSGNQAKTYATSPAFSWGCFNYCLICTNWSSGSWYNCSATICITPNNGSAVDVAYIELVEGTETDIKLVKKTAVYKGTELDPNTAAIQTTIPVKGYTVGGVRPALPQKGDCWFPVSNNRITSVQIYTGTHWEEVNARWYTGTRWIPIYAFDITTLEDLFDIADGDSVVPLLPDQNSFFRWWQLQWLDFRAWLEGALSNIGSGGGGTSLPDDETLPGEVDDPATDNDDGWSFVDLLVKTKDGIWRITKGIVRTAAGGITGLVVLINDAGDFFEPFQEGYTDGVGDLMDYGGDDIWD